MYVAGTLARSIVRTMRLTVPRPRTAGRVMARRATGAYSTETSKISQRSMFKVGWSSRTLITSLLDNRSSRRFLSNSNFKATKPHDLATKRRKNKYNSKLYFKNLEKELIPKNLNSATVLGNVVKLPEGASLTGMGKKVEQFILQIKDKRPPVVSYIFAFNRPANDRQRLPKSTLQHYSADKPEKILKLLEYIKKNPNHYDYISLNPADLSNVYVLKAIIKLITMPEVTDQKLDMKGVPIGMKPDDFKGTPLDELMKDREFN